MRRPPVEGERLRRSLPLPTHSSRSFHLLARMAGCTVMTAAAKPASASAITFARVMTQLDANLLGTVHGGVIMREVDAAAGLAAARHTGRIPVTVAIDELSFLQPVNVGDILIVQAQVNAVGRTSLEVGVRVEAEP